MCGLGGVAGRLVEEDAAMVATMIDKQRHRGPDHGGIRVFDKAVLGHRRLRIIDLRPSADQPMTGEDGRYWVIFNGEIYNFEDLRRRLEAAGHCFVSRSDTEVIVHLVEEHGPTFARHLRGMFAIAVWDSWDRELTLVRDRLGIKPLYYRNDGNRLLFASEARSLPGARPLLDEHTLARYLQLGWVPGPSSVYEKVKELPPGHCLRWSDEKVTIERWWNPPEPAGPLNARELGSVLEEAVGRHLVADVPVGVFLSSGVDSAVVAALVSRFANDATAYTVAFPDTPDEAEGASRIARHYGLPHEVVPVSGMDVLGWIDDFVAAIDEPTVDGLNTWVISRGVHDCGAVVALSGLGGDELFAGYSTFRLVPRIAAGIGLASVIPGPLRDIPAWLTGLSRRTAHRRERKVLDALRTPSPGAAYAAVRGVMSAAEVERLRGGWGRELRRRPAVSTSGRADVYRLELENYLPNQLLRDTDVMSMAHSLEVRVPLLDDEVVAAATSTRSTVEGPRGKQLLAAAVDPWLLELTRAPKRTFTLPVETWLRGPLRNWSVSALDQLGCAGLGFDRGELDRFARDFHDGYAGWRSMWALSLLGVWVAKQPA